MVTRETGFGVFASAMLAIVALPLVACGDSTRANGTRGNGSGGSSGASGSTASGGSGGSSGSMGGSPGGSNGVGGATGGGAATAGSGGDAGRAGAGGTGDAGGGGAGGEEESATFHWIEATDEHRERAASATEPAFLRTSLYPSFDAAVLIGHSDLTIGDPTEEVYTEGIVWTEATGTTALGGLPGAIPRAFTVLSNPRAISADGSVVVGSALNSQNRSAPFRWTRADGMEALAEEGVAVAVSADGSVVWGDLYQPQNAVFRWTRALGAVTIVEPFAGHDAIRVLALSADGATVLGESYRADETAASLFVWTEGSGTRAVENLPGFTHCPVGFVTSSGSYGFAVGGRCYGENGVGPFVWAGQDHLVALGPTDALGGAQPDQPVAVAVDGSVAVGNSFGTIESHGYRWTEANGLELLALPEGSTAGAPVISRSTMSEDGSVVVGRMNGIALGSFLWSEGTGAVVLSPLEGHDTSEVHVVSADGSVAAGSSRLGTADYTAVYWGADGVAHRVADELAAGGVDLGGGTLREVRAAHAQLDFFGYGSKDEVSVHLAWRARAP